MSGPIPSDSDSVHVLSSLTLGEQGSAAPPDPRPLAFVAALDLSQRDSFLAIAGSHHVVIRSLAALQRDAALAGNEDVRAWAAAAMAREQARIDAALPVFDSVCSALAEAGCPTTVIKTLDHWPDIGSDLDLYTTGDHEKVIRTMLRRFKACLQPRSWGDRLAHKWEFVLPGLRESVEIHCRRLGQTGEHTRMARRFVTRRTFRTIQGHSFPVPAPEESVIIATLQRMYRHFYFRLSDILNTAAMLEANAIDFAELRTAADLGAIWPGVATCLKLVVDYVARYRTAPALPAEIQQAALFGGEHLFVKKRFIRLPVLPYGARLYARQLANTAVRGDVPATLRLTLLPPLASLAVVAHKLTGSHKGIW